MFTGIIESVGCVEDISTVGQSSSFTVSNPCTFDDAVKGASLAVNGVCLTYLEVLHAKGADSYRFELSGETSDRTNLKFLRPNNRVNLERALKAGSRFDGHIVLGHVDCTVKFKGSSISASSGNIFSFTFDPRSADLIVEKGSIALNGTSLTCFDVQRDSFKVAVLPYTLKGTNLGSLKAGDEVNCEFDVLGKYVKKIISKGSEKSSDGGIDLKFLREHGF